MAAPEIAILYGDLSITRVPWNKKRTLKGTNVIAVAVLSPTARKRHQALIQNDFYFLTWSDTDCCLWGHDGDDGWFNFENPDNADWRFPFQLYKNTIMFEGVLIPGGQYAKAKAIFSDPHGGMF